MSNNKIATINSGSIENDDNHNTLYSQKQDMNDDTNCNKQRGDKNQTERTQTELSTTNKNKKKEPPSKKKCRDSLPRSGNIGVGLMKQTSRVRQWRAKSSKL